MVEECAAGAAATLDVVTLVPWILLAASLVWLAGSLVRAYSRHLTRQALARVERSLRMRPAPSRLPQEGAEPAPDRPAPASLAPPAASRGRRPSGAAGPPAALEQRRRPLD